MKKKILTLGAVLVLVTVLVLPTAALAQVITEVTGTVTEGSTFTAPSGVAFGDMNPNATPSTSDSTGYLKGNDPDGYTVTGVDSTGTLVGFMTATGPIYLTNMLQMGATNAVPNTAATVTTFLTTTGPGPTDEAVPFYVSQTVLFTDTIAVGYTITITFTVVSN